MSLRDFFGFSRLRLQDCLFGTTIGNAWSTPENQVRLGVIVDGTTLHLKVVKT